MKACSSQAARSAGSPMFGAGARCRWFSITRTGFPTTTGSRTFVSYARTARRPSTHTAAGIFPASGNASVAGEALPLGLSDTGIAPRLVSTPLGQLRSSDPDRVPASENRDSRRARWSGRDTSSSCERSRRRAFWLLAASTASPILRSASGFVSTSVRSSASEWARRSEPSRFTIRGWLAPQRSS